MTTIIPESPTDADHEREIAKARAEVIRRAEAQGIKPFTSLEEFAGDAETSADFDVDEFLRQVHQDRDRPTVRSDD